MNAKELYGESKEESFCEIAKWPEYDTKSNPKVLFILKEPSTRNNKGKEYNFQKELENPAIFKSKSGMWKQLARCSEMFQRIFKDQSPDLDDLKKSDNKLLEMLHQSSFTNLKRFGYRKSSSYMRLVGLHAGLFWQLIIGEIKEVKPDIIICAGTFEIIFELLNNCLPKIPDYVKKNGYCNIGDIKPFGEVEDNDIWKWRCKDLVGKEIIIVKRNHPARTGPEYFNELKDIAIEIKCDTRYFSKK